MVHVVASACFEALVDGTGRILGEGVEDRDEWSHTGIEGGDASDEFGQCTWGVGLGEGAYVPVEAAACCRTLGLSGPDCWAA